MNTVYTLPDGRQTYDYQAWKDAKAEHAAVQTAFHNHFGAHMATPESRRAAIEAMREGDLEKSGTFAVPAAAPQSRGGLTAAEVNRRAAVAMTGSVNRHGAVEFPIPSASRPPVSDAGGPLPPGAVRVSFYGGIPQS